MKTLDCLKNSNNVCYYDNFCKQAPKIGMVVGAILLALGPVLFCYGIGRFPIMAGITAGGLVLTVACAILTCCQPKKGKVDKPTETPAVAKPTSAHVIAYEGTLEALQKEIEGQGTTCLNQNSEFGSLLHCAIHAVDSDCQAKLNYLLSQNGIDIEARNSKGLTPFLLAIALNNPAAVEALLQKGANLFAKTDENETALHLAVRYSNPDHQIVQRVLSDSKKKLTPDEYAAFVNAKSKDGFSALLRSIEMLNASDYKALLENGAIEPNLNTILSIKLREIHKEFEKEFPGDPEAFNDVKRLKALPEKSNVVLDRLAFLEIQAATPKKGE